MTIKRHMVMETYLASLSPSQKAKIVVFVLLASAAAFAAAFMLANPLVATIVA